MKIKLLFVLFMLSVPVLIGNAQAQNEFISGKIKKYVDFIDKCQTSPVDYVMELFDKYDIVILGERDHRDTTQYDLVEQIISDPRFIENVGHVMTEIGVYNMTEKVDLTLCASYGSNQEFETALWSVYKELDYMPLWENTNFYQYLHAVYRINKMLPEEKKIHITLTDIPFSWSQTEGMTHRQFQDFLKVWDNKDMIMANNALTELYKLFDGRDTRKKALIIFNAPHSYGAVVRQKPNKRMQKEQGRYAAQIIMERFPGRVANVAINWAKRHDGYMSLVQDGRWDAAFAACGNKSIGFNLAQSPFGEDDFDMRPRSFKGCPKYKEVYTGYIFYKPIGEWLFGIGIPNMTDDDFADELVRRDCIWSGEPVNSPEERAEIYDYYAKIRSFRFLDLSGEASFCKKCDRQINKYYKPGIRKGEIE